MLLFSDNLLTTFRTSSGNSNVFVVAKFELTSCCHPEVCFVFQISIFQLSSRSDLNETFETNVVNLKIQMFDGNINLFMCECVNKNYIGKIMLLLLCKTVIVNRKIKTRHIDADKQSGRHQPNNPTPNKAANI